VSDSDLLLVFDCNNVVIRAHAGMMKSGLSSSKGVPTGGIFGAIRTFNTYIQKLKPTHVLCFWDYGRSTFRTALRSDYKGDRPKPAYLEPGELQLTFQLFEEYLYLSGVSSFKEQGIEADDLIAGCVFSLRDQTPISIITADHDLRQLVRQPDPYPVTVVKPSMSGTKPNEQTYTYQSVIDEYKLPPHRLAELWAIEGDQSDNLTGLKGYGPAKSRKLLEEFGTLDNVIANSPAMQGFERHIHENYRMIKLPGEATPERSYQLEDHEFQYNPVNVQLLIDFFEEYELNSFKKQLEEGTLFTPRADFRQGLHNL